MFALIASLALAGVLLAAAGLKLADPPGTRAALATYGLTGLGARLAWMGIISFELAISICVVLGISLAAYLGAGLLAAFALAQLTVMARGKTGAPCACFGAAGRVSQASFTRTLLLAAAFAALPLVPRGPLDAVSWLGVGLAVTFAGLVGLGVVVLSLARELGALKLRLGPEGALEIAHEGPEIGARTKLVEAFAADRLAPEQLALAVFTSEGCGLCRALAPAVVQMGREPEIALRTFDERFDADAWAIADVPGSPFAVAVAPDGTVLAKGTFNSGGQLESVIAAALRRRREQAAHA